MAVNGMTETEGYAAVSYSYEDSEVSAFGPEPKIKPQEEPSSEDAPYSVPQGLSVPPEITLVSLSLRMLSSVH